MAPFTEGIRRRNEGKPVDSALDMLSLRFPCRASWGSPEVYKNLKLRKMSRLEVCVLRDEMCITASLKSFSNAT